MPWLPSPFRTLLAGYGRRRPVGAAAWIPLLWCFLVVLSPNLFAALHDDFASPLLRSLRLFFALGFVLLPAALLPTAWLPWLALPVAVAVPLEFLHIHLMGCPSTIGILHSLLETTPQEVGELVRQEWRAVLVLLLFPLSAIVALKAHRAAKPGPLPGKVRLAVGVFAIAGILSEPAHIVWFFRATMHRVAIQAEATQQTQRTFPFGTLWKAWEVAANRIDLVHREEIAAKFRWHPSTSTPDTTRETYVVVIGESSRSGNWSLYGYGRPTTPRLQADSEIVVFADATSGANITLESIPLIMTLATPRDPKIFDTTSSVVSCFRQAGFKTWWLSTQGRFTVWDSKPAMIGQEAEVVEFLSSERLGRKTLDAALLPALDAALADTATKKLVVIHTNGSHYPYEIRYTPEFEVFRPDSALSDTMARYDNSILATDWLLESVLDRLRSRSEVAGFAYVSDHGEALGEKGRYFHCGLDPVRAEFEIPYLAWVSPRLAALRPSVLPMLRAHRERKVTHSEFLPTLLGIAGIGSDRIDSTRSLAGPWFREHPRRAITPSHRLVDVDTREGSSLAARGATGR